MKYYNSTTRKYYTEGKSITVYDKGILFTGIPSVEQLTTWGYEPYVPLAAPESIADDLKRQRMAEILIKLSSMDYLTSKYVDGEDMSVYDAKYGGDWKAYRHGLREEFNRLEKELV